ncbi:MAG: hypothetical protein FWC64_02820 [Treponema sp.]|nr:hypothetical protein [Treponema sp.]
MNNSVFQGDIDPEIAALLGTNAKPKAEESVPDFTHLFGREEGVEPGEADEPDLTSEGFPPLTKRLEEIPHTTLQDPEYYKTALSGEGNIAQRVHTILQKYLHASDPKDRSVFRQQFIPAFWEFLVNVARRSPGKLSGPKKYLLRFGILHPAFLNPAAVTLLSRVVVENELNQPVYYLDEWFRAIGTGVIRNSTTDEVRVAKSSHSMKLRQLLEKARGKQDGAKALLRAKDEERIRLEKTLVERVSLIAEHHPVTGLPEINSCYNEGQKRVFSDVYEIMKTLLKSDQALSLLIRDYNQAAEDVKTIKTKIEEDGGAVEVDVRALDTEFETVKQMAKMTIGRQGNHFPILTKEYFHCHPNDVGFRENVISMLAWVESIDPGAFCRMYKNRLNRIVPYVVLVPSYGETGFCWEPFDRFNRATSRGRIAIPMYPRSMQIAILSAVADLRWQVAKEKASYYWMEEGITGNYYQWFQKMRGKGDLKESFIQDYIFWMTKESEGTQKLDKELRGVFWRHIPFAQPIKEKLKTRNYVYQELYQRDLNRAMSDGY